MVRLGEHIIAHKNECTPPPNTPREYQTTLNQSYHHVIEQMQQQATHCGRVT